MSATKIPVSHHCSHRTGDMEETDCAVGGVTAGGCSGKLLAQQFHAGMYPTKMWAVYSPSNEIQSVNTSVPSVPKYASDSCYVPGIVLEAGDMSAWRLNSRRGDRRKPEKIKTTDNASRRENAGAGKGGSELQCSAEGYNVRMGGRRAYREDSL